MTLFILAIIIFIKGSRLCTAGDTLLQGQTLSGNQTLVSKNGIFELGLFVDYYAGLQSYSLGIWIVNSSHTVLWVANRENPLQNSLTSELNIFSTGNLVLMQSQKLIWSTNLTSSEETTPTIAVLLDTGNLVLKEDNNISRIVWQSFDHPTDTWFAGASLGFNAAIGKNVYLTYADHVSGSITFRLELDPRRASGFIIRHLSSNATYHGIFPQLIDIVDDGNGLATYNVTNKSHTFMKLDYNGIINGFIHRFIGIYYWVKDSSNFNPLWFDPNNMCDFDAF